jgi:F-type H+-transporting ATPase subunit alpha
MAELSINAQEIAEVLRRNIENFTPGIAAEEVGRISEIGDGIVRITGLPNAAVNEVLDLEGGLSALALNLDEDSIGAVVLGETKGLQEGQLARATGRILSVPVGDALLGRVVDPLGRPLDGLGPIASSESRRLEIQAPGIVDRQPVKQPLQTGIKAIDSMTPIGRGQRELIMHLRGSRAEGFYCGPDRGHAEGPWCNGLHRGHQRAGFRPRALQVPRPLRGVRDGPALDGKG